MQQLFNGTVYDMVAKPDGLVFSYLEDMIDGNLLVKFKMIDARSGGIADIAKNVYLIAKFGSNYRPVVKKCSNFITAKTIILPSGKLFLCERDGNCFLFDGDGSVLWNGIILYRDDPPSDIALYNNCIWASFSDNNVLVRFNIEAMREELRIGGERSPFQKPRGIFIEGNIATVCNLGSNSLTRVNLDTYSAEQYHRFDKGVKAYIKEDVYEFVLLEDGIYSL